MSTFRVAAAVLLGGALTTACASARPPQPPPVMEARAMYDDLSELLEPFRAQGAMPAIGAAVWRDGHLVAMGVRGVRKQGDPTPVAVGDGWHLGSDTKAMTATLVGLYVERGRLRFEDTVGELFRGEALDPGWANVRVEQLLEHRGGAPHELPSEVFEQMIRDGRAPDARIKAVRSMLAAPPAQAPGTFAYSNGGYMILGAALERVEGVTWEALVERELFAPLGMRSCGFGAPGHWNRVDAPWGHASEDGRLVPVSPGPGGDNPPALGPAGTVHCSLEDWGKFLSMHVAGGRGERTLLSPETMRRLHTPPAGGDYAAGWVVAVRPWALGATLSHTGSNTMWTAVAWLAPARKLAFAVVTNRFGNGALEAVDAATLALIARYAR